MSLKQTLVSAIGWAVVIKLLIQLAIWAMTLLVIRIIPPDDYGLMAVSQIFVSFMAGFGSLGFGDALIQREDTPKQIVARVFGLQIGIALVLTVVLALAAYPIAEWYHDPRLTLLIQVSGLGFLLNALKSLPRCFLTKSLRIRPMFIIEAGSGLIGSATVLALAHAGHGVWALMLGSIVTQVVQLILFVALMPEYYVWPRFGFAGVGPLFSFGIYRTFEYTIWTIFTSADVLIISWWFGPAAVGIYSVAANFATMPLNKIAPIINTTIFPAFAMVQSRPADARFYALKASRLMAGIAVPVFFGISATAPEVVDLVFGPNWIAAKPVLGVIALAIAFRAILLVIPNFLQGIGDSRAGFWCTAMSATIFPPAFVVGCHWGIVGVAYAWVLGYPVVYAISALIASNRGGPDIRSLLLAPAQPMIAGAIMIVAVMIARDLLPAAWSEAASFAALMMVGAIVYPAALFLLFRGLAMEMAAMIQRAPSAAE